MSSILFLATPRAFSVIQNPSMTSTEALNAAISFCRSRAFEHNLYGLSPTPEFYVFALRARNHIEQNVVILAHKLDGPYGPNDRDLPDFSDGVFPPSDDLRLGIVGDLIRLSID